MLSRDHGITVDEAFELLRSYSRSHNSNLREVAERVVHHDLQVPEPG
jgi:AmiR/NasT family two-component response regulator